MARRDPFFEPLDPARGASVNADGAFLGPLPLLVKTPFGFKPRPCEEIDHAVATALGSPFSFASRYGGLAVVADSINKSDWAKAAIALGAVGIQDSPGWVFVIQAVDGQIRFDGRPMGEDGTALPGQSRRSWS